MIPDEILKAALDLARERVRSHGCIGCDFEDRAEWAMPCSRCKRNCKDYWRPIKEMEEGGSKNADS